MSARTSSLSSTTVHSLSLLSEYTNTLDTLPLELSRHFADLRELDAVLSSSMNSITEKIQKLTQQIEEGTAGKEERLWLLTQIADEAARLKLGGEDKIRVACLAADNLKSHSSHLRTLLEHLPGFDTSILNRRTTYPHVAARSYMPTNSLESGRRRRGGFGSLLSSAPDQSPAKRKRVIRDEDLDGGGVRSPRKDKVTDTNARPRNNGRVKRAASPTESILSVASHIPAQGAQNHGNPSRVAASSTSTRPTNGASTNKRARSSANNNGHNRHSTPQSIHDQHHNGTLGYDQPNHMNSSNSRRDIYNVPPSSSHPSLPPPYTSNGIHHYELTRSVSNPGGGANSLPGDWSPTHLPPNQLEGPGMPVARDQTSHPGMSLAASSALGISPHANVSTPPGGNGSNAGGLEGTPGDGGDGDGDGDDRTYCICDGISYGEMIACDDENCDKEWFHLTCIGLTIPPEGTWYCDTCRNKRSRRTSRGGKRRTTGSRSGARGTTAGA